MAEHSECLADRFGTFVDHSVRCSGVERLGELRKIDIDVSESWVFCVPEVHTVNKAAFFVEFGEEIRRLDTCVAPSVVVDEGWSLGRCLGLTHVVLYSMYG